MKRHVFNCRLVMALWAAVALAAAASTGCGAVSPALGMLAARAHARRGWPALRSYARSARNPEVRGLAYFTLGYREYSAGAYPPAAEDLREAAATGFSLSDFACYYEALADEQLHRDNEAAQALAGFSSRYPESTLGLRATDLLASSLIKAGQPDRALAALGAGPEPQSRPSSLSLAAKAYSALGENLEAARNWLQVYYGFPVADEAQEAAAALQELRIRLGRNYPQVSDETKTARAKKLFQHGDYPRALSDYDNLLLAEPHGPFADPWRLARAECLLGLRRYPEAADALKDPVRNNAALDARRLALLVHADELAANQPAMLSALDEMYKQYPRSFFYGDALAFAGGYFARQGFWQTATRYYEPLALGFPHGLYGREASWRAAWYSLLAGQTDAAQSAIAHFLERYPKSWQAPAALYWLGALDRRQGKFPEAKALGRFLATRFPNNYYGLKARPQFAVAAASLRSAQGRLSPPVSAMGTSPLQTSAGDVLANFNIAVVPRLPAELSPCGNEPDLPQIYRTLVALSLHHLAIQYLQSMIAKQPHNAQLLLALARLQTSGGDPAGALFAARQAVPRYEEYPFSALRREVWEYLYPHPYWSLVRRYARAEHLDPYLVMGLIRQESAFNPRATSRAGARGLMQMEPGTAALHVRGRQRRKRAEGLLYSPAYNIRVSCLYLRRLLAKFGGNVPEALAAYNAGDLPVEQWITNGKLQDPEMFMETIPFMDTQAYVVAVMRDEMIYRQLLGGTAKFNSCEAAASLRRARTDRRL